jgi:DNA-binding NarL/FixJ family response regulator
MPPLRVLMVDDYEPFLQVLRAILPSDRFHVIAQAPDGLEAIKKAELLQPDLILLDVGLPRLNGIEVARKVKELFSRTAILMLSQDTSPEVVWQESDSSATACLILIPQMARPLTPPLTVIASFTIQMSRSFWTASPLLSLMR